MQIADSIEAVCKAQHAAMQAVTQQQVLLPVHACWLTQVEHITNKLVLLVACCLLHLQEASDYGLVQMVRLSIKTGGSGQVGATAWSLCLEKLGTAAPQAYYAHAHNSRQARSIAHCAERRLTLPF
jgi:hypothetical protein